MALEDNKECTGVDRGKKVVVDGDSTQDSSGAAQPHEIAQDMHSTGSVQVSFDVVGMTCYHRWPEIER